jgi:hypothetical protein
MTNAHYILAGIICVGFFGLSIFYFVFPDKMPEAISDHIGLIVGSWISNFTLVVGYFFGSSKSSSDKTDLIKKMSEKA